MGSAVYIAGAMRTPIGKLNGAFLGLAASDLGAAVINALLDEANRISGAKRYSMNTLKLKVYVRRPADLPAIQAIVSREQSAESPLYLNADICREDLLVEIEATGEARIG